MDHVTIGVSNACGYRGKSSHRAYVAQIVGTSDAYVFAREFLGTEPEDRAEMLTARRKGRGTWREVAQVGVGLYEIQHSDGSRAYRVVRPASETEMAAGKAPLLRLAVDADRAQAMALLLDEGMDVEAARRATMPPKSTGTAAEADGGAQ